MDLSRSEFVEPIASIVGEGARVVSLTKLDPAGVEEADAVIICGTALADDGYLDHQERLAWLSTTDVPVLGICAGMQLVALHNGASLVPGKEIGMVPIEPTMDNPLITEPMEVYCLHKYDLEDLDQFQVLARSTRCVQAISHGERQLYGIVFHPEVRRGGVVSRFLDEVR
jgi:GMP synthase (glutamine-hydrolysing)